MAKDYKHEMPYDDGWKKLKGPLSVKLTNDYLFRALLQADEETLKALVADLLHLNVSDVTEIEITNPIKLGETIDDKEFHLDISAILNESINVNLEMQVLHEMNWIERSMLYAFRSFDSLSHGEDYMDAEGVIQISFTDFTLFEDAPEFYSTFKLINVKNHSQVYSEKIRISNVNLRRIDLATEEDKLYRIDQWAKLFKAESWEEIKMLTEKTPDFEKTVSSIWQLSEEEKIREQIRRRNANEHTYQRFMDHLHKQDEELKMRAKDLDMRAEDLDTRAEDLKTRAEDLNQREDDIQQKEEDILHREDDIQQKEEGLQQKEKGLQQKEKYLQQEIERIEEEEKERKRLFEENEELRKELERLKRTSQI